MVCYDDGLGAGKSLLALKTTDAASEECSLWVYQCNSLVRVCLQSLIQVSVFSFWTTLACSKEFTANSFPHKIKLLHFASLLNNCFKWVLRILGVLQQVLTCLCLCTAGASTSYLQSAIYSLWFSFNVGEVLIFFSSMWPCRTRGFCARKKRGSFVIPQTGCSHTWT